ncbi:MAG: GntR family transcriptional regulator [Candidatus Dormibacteraeota bacterium]|nr:GntR family transcriptional regulator [Candidatus Dormibacteraeota bacterium]
MPLGIAHPDAPSPLEARDTPRTGPLAGQHSAKLYFTLTTPNLAADPTRRSAAKLAPLSPPTLGATALEALRASILQGRFQPGDRLVESTISRELAISRGPLREALNFLEKEGLVESVPRRGKFVVQLTQRTLDETYRLRRILEAEAVRLLVSQLSSRKERTLQLGIKRMKDAVGQGDPLRLALADLAFHDLIYELAGDALLLRVWRENFAGTLRLLINLTGRTHPLGATLDNHRALVAAIVSSDGNKACRLAEEHVDDAWNRARISFPGAARAS